MKILAFLLTIMSLNQMAYAESTLKGVDLAVCNQNSDCIRVQSKTADVGMLQSVYVLKNVQVTGLGFENKVISSAVVDLKSGQLVLRERKNNILKGEWTVKLNDLSMSFTEAW